MTLRASFRGALGGFGSVARPCDLAKMVNNRLSYFHVFDVIDSVATEIDKSVRSKEWASRWLGLVWTRNLFLGHDAIARISFVNGLLF